MSLDKLVRKLYNVSIVLGAEKEECVKEMKFVLAEYILDIREFSVKEIQNMFEEATDTYREYKGHDYI